MKANDVILIGKNDKNIDMGDLNYPLSSFDKKQTLFIGDVLPYKSYFGKYSTPDKTCKKVNTGKYDIEEVKEWLGLESEDRMYRGWECLSLGVRWRATVAVGILSEKKYYSLPILKDSSTQYWVIGAELGLWDKLKELDYKILVSEEDCEWLTKN